MGCVKKGDSIIITQVLWFGDTNPGIEGKTSKVLFIDTILRTFPYKIEINDRVYWVEGVLESSLMMELM